jgi:hypothetical protein
MSATLPVMIGAVIGWWYNRRSQRSADPARAEHLGVLVASGLIVGESLFGVLIAGLIVGLSSDAPLALVSGDFAPATFIGLIGYIAIGVLLYAWMLRKSFAPAK